MHQCDPLFTSRPSPLFFFSLFLSYSLYSLFRLLSFILPTRSHIDFETLCGAHFDVYLISSEYSFPYIIIPLLPTSSHPSLSPFTSHPLPLTLSFLFSTLPHPSLPVSRSIPSDRYCSPGHPVYCYRQPLVWTGTAVPAS